MRFRARQHPSRIHPSSLYWQGQLTRLNVERMVECAVDVLGNLPTRIRPQPLLRHRQRQESPSRSLLD